MRYTLFPDEDGNYTITKGGEGILIKLAGKEGVEISETEALELLSQVES